MKRRLPTGIHTLGKIREGGYDYVDKTAYIERLRAVGTHFSSRGRSDSARAFSSTR